MLAMLDECETGIDSGRTIPGRSAQGRFHISGRNV